MYCSLIRVMSSYKEHCLDCEKILGKQWNCVHLWLDEMFRHMGGNWIHRSFRHHAEGIEEARKMWGDEAAEAAKIHIMKDFPGLKEPPKAEDYKRKDLVYFTDFMMGDEEPTPPTPSSPKATP